MLSTPWQDARAIRWFFLCLGAILTFVLDDSHSNLQSFVPFHGTVWILPPSLPPSLLFLLPLPISPSLHLPVPLWSLSDLSLSSLTNHSLLLPFKVWVSGVLFIPLHAFFTLVQREHGASRGSCRRLWRQLCYSGLASLKIICFYIFFLKWAILALQGLWDNWHDCPAKLS